MINCPACASESKVLDTREIDGTARRRRECIKCGERWSTMEIALERYRSLDEAHRAHTMVSNAAQTLRKTLADFNSLENYLKTKASGR